MVEVCKMGRMTVLTSDEELTLVQYCKERAARGFPISSSGLLDEVQIILKDDGRQHNFKVDFVYQYYGKHSTFVQAYPKFEHVP